MFYDKKYKAKIVHVTVLSVYGILHLNLVHRQSFNFNSRTNKPVISDTVC